MRRLFLHINVSLDGYITDPAGDLDWAFADAEFQDHIDRLLESIDGMVFGRGAFEQLEPYWPHAGEEVSATQRRLMHALPKYVLSHRPVETDWHNVHWLGADPAAALRELKAQDGRDLALFAGGGAASAAIGLGVLDQLRLVVNPALLGGGIRLFDGSYPSHELRHTDTHRFGGGAVLLTYEVAGQRR